MAEAKAAAAGGKGLGETLKKKVGPLPLGVWLAAGIVAVWYFRKQQAGQSANPAAQQSQTGYGTDPAGNTGYIDPQTGYVYGSAEDIAALQSQGQVATNSYNTGGAGDTSGTGAAGGSVGTNPSGTATGTPGAPPGPTVPTPGGAPASNKDWHYPAPSGLAASSVSDSGFSLSWSPVQGPSGQKPPNYTVATYQGSGSKVDQFISGSTSTKEYGSGGKGLKPSTQYRVNVWANGGPVAPPHATIVVTTKPRGTK